MKEYIYKLILEDRLFVEDNWTTQDEEHVSNHFKHLESLLAKNQLILAGKTAGLDSSTYGIVLFQADSYEDALDIMNHDPAVVSGIMTATLHEYTVALFNHAYKKE